MTSKIIYGCKPIQSSIDNRYHYVYRITNLVENKHYYGSRSSKLHPFIDLGTKYFGTPSSEKNRWIKKDQKDNPSHYKYKILRCFETRQEATGLEVFIHKKFDVKLHKKFYNESNQTSTGFDTTGRVVVKDTSGATFLCDVDDPRILSGEFVSIFKGKTAVIDNNGNTLIIQIDDPLYLAGEYTKLMAGKTVFKDLNGVACILSVDDPRIAAGEFVGITSGVPVAEEVRVAIRNTLKAKMAAGGLFGEEHRKNLQIGSKGKPKQKEHTQKGVRTRKEKKIGMGRNHWKSKYIYHTPWGSFDSPTALEPEFTMQRMKNMCLNNQGIMTNKSYYSCEKLVKTHPPSIIGKSYKEIGFSVTDLQKS